MNVQVTARKADEAQVKTAQAYENFLRALEFDFSSPRTAHNLAPYYRCLDSATIYGAGLLRVDFDSEIGEMLRGKLTDLDDLKKALAEIAKDGFTQNPFTVDCPDINACAWDPNFENVVEVGERALSKVLAAIEDEKEREDVRGFFVSEVRDEGEFGTGKDYMAKVYHLETKDHIYDVVAYPTRGSTKEGFMLDCRPTLIGRPWYTILVGRGPNADAPPVERYRPLIGPLYPIVQKLYLLSTLLNSGALQTGRVAYQLVQEGRQQAAPDFLSYLSMPSGERPTLHFNLTDDAVHHPPAGYRYTEMPVPDQRWLIEAYQEAKRELAEYGFPAPLSPDQSLTAASSSGYQSAFQAEQASFFVEPALRNLAASTKERFLIISAILKELNIKATIPVHPMAQGMGSRFNVPVTIKPEEIKDVDITVEFDATTQTGQFAQDEMDMRKLQATVMSRQTYMQRHYEDPVSEEERIKLEQGEMEMDKLALADALAIVQETRGDLMEQAAAEAGVPLPQDLAPAPGGPAPGEEFRQERPPAGAVPGVGAPVVPPQQGAPV